MRKWADSLARRTRDYEIIAVDDGSTDATPRQLFTDSDGQYDPADLASSTARGTVEGAALPHRAGHSRPGDPPSEGGRASILVAEGVEGVARRRVLEVDGVRIGRLGREPRDVDPAEILAAELRAGLRFEVRLQRSCGSPANCGQ